MNPEQQKIVDNFNARKEHNSLSIVDRGYSLEEYASNQFYLINNKTKQSACTYCFATTNQDPFRNCAKDVSIAPICHDCMKEIFVIEIIIFGKDQTTPRRTKTDPQKIKINWELIEKLINNRQAKLLSLSDRYNIYPREMKELLITKYGNQIKFARGRGGGIQFISSSPKEIPPPINWQSINSLINNRQAKLSALAKDYKLNVKDMRKVLIKHYGDKIDFKRGRHGGIKFTKVK